MRPDKFVGEGAPLPGRAVGDGCLPGAPFFPSSAGSLIAQHALPAPLAVYHRPGDGAGVGQGPHSLGPN
jgi:hypothetical protein